MDPAFAGMTNLHFPERKDFNIPEMDINHALDQPSYSGGGSASLDPSLRSG